MRVPPRLLAQVVVVVVDAHSVQTFPPFKERERERERERGAAGTRAEGAPG